MTFKSGILKIIVPFYFSELNILLTLHWFYNSNSLACQKNVKDMGGKRLVGILSYPSSALSLPFIVYELFYISINYRKQIIMKTILVHINANKLCSP